MGRAKSVGLKEALLADRSTTGKEPPFRPMTEAEDRQLKVVAGGQYERAKKALQAGDGDGAAVAIQDDINGRVSPDSPGF